MSTNGRTPAIPILLVDDDRVHLRLLRARLSRAGYTVLTAADGAEGMALARSHRPMVVLCDWLMERMDGVEFCRLMRADPELASTYFILLTSRSRVEDRVHGLDAGADDFLSKPVDSEELLARVRSGVRLYQANEHLQLMADELQRQKSLLDAELAEAATYVRSLLPAPTWGGPTGEAVLACSRFVPSHELGGDVFDYFWIDPDHFAVYLADASGHGLAAAFPSISLHNVLRSKSLRVDLRRPGAVLEALNQTFAMERQQGRYLTLWYGVYQPRRRRLRYASAGHPPALLWSTEQRLPLSKLSGHGMALGLFEEARYTSTSLDVPLNASLLLYSDGIYEVPRPDGSIGDLNDFLRSVEVTRPQLAGEHGLDALVDSAAGTGFSDDYCLLLLRFPGVSLSGNGSATQATGGT